MANILYDNVAPESFLVRRPDLMSRSYTTKGIVGSPENAIVS